MLASSEVVVSCDILITLNQMKQVNEEEEEVREDGIM